MAIFVVVGQPGPRAPSLVEAIEREPENNTLQIREGVWLVAYAGTAVDLSNRLQITTEDATSGAAAVFGVADYYGRAKPNIWAWIKEKWGATGG